ncbi:MAG: nucleotidyltransferase domain-containing protein [Acidobacteria bacterium]|nr:nucleotidyltransferase domain-containing protein [Acidobacteriota bacterium]
MPKELSSGVKIFYPRFSRDELVERLRERLPALNKVLPLQKVVLFGSWARGKATPFSDIDLLVIYAGPLRQEAYQLVWTALDLRGLELHVYSEEEARKRQPTLERMTRTSLALFP